MHCKKLVSMSLSSLAVVCVAFLLTMLTTGTTYALNHSGNITSNETWSVADNPHIVTENVSVWSDAVLTIEPGCLVKFDAGRRLSFGAVLSGTAALNAVGTSVNPITFTSNAGTPAPGDWDGILFRNNTDDAATIMDYCTVEYGVNNIFCSDASPTIQHCILRNASYSGFRAEGSGIALFISCSAITNNVHGVRASVSGSIVVVDCSITCNTGFGVYSGSTYSTIDAENNWWGNASGPSGAGPGTGDVVSSNVDFTPWLTSPPLCVDANAVCVLVTPTPTPSPSPSPTPSPTPQECVPPPSGMVSWWRAENDANDFVGTNNGAMTNGATFAAGKVGQAFSFDGVDDEVVVPHNANLNTGSQITIDAWVNASSYGHGRPIAQKRSSSNVGGYTFETTHSPWAPDYGLHWVIWIGGTWYDLETPANVLTNSAWYHVAATFDGTTMKVYVNGLEKDRKSVSGVIDAVTDDFVIGRNVVDTSFAWHGLIDELEIFNRALTDSEISDIYNAGSAGKCTDTTPTPTPSPSPSPEPSPTPTVEPTATYVPTPTPTPSPSPSPTPQPSPTEPPTAVSLASFKAKVNGDGSVTLAWKTASEVDNAGFNIYRSKRTDGTYKKVNGKLIPAQGNGAYGASYSFEETPGSGAFYYKLEDVDYNGTSAMHGPVKVRVRSAEGEAKRRRR